MIKRRAHLPFLPTSALRRRESPASQESQSRDRLVADENDAIQIDGEVAPDNAADPDQPSAKTEPLQLKSTTRAAIAFGMITVLALAGLTGWLGLRAHQSCELAQQRRAFLEVGRQAALDLTTINYTHAETDVQRILDSATGPFHDDFQQRSPAFIEVVKQAQSISEGTITEAALESVDGDRAQVIVAVTVKTSTPASADQQPRGWRMRIGVQKDGDGAKISSVRFVQ